MPFRPDPFLKRFEPLRQLRQKRPWLGYVVAAGGTGIATLLRLEVGDVQAPFITFYPVVIAATLLGNYPVGLVSIGLSAIAADLFIIEPARHFSWSAGDQLTVGVYLVVAASLVLIVSLLNEAIDRLWRQADNVRLVLETQPAGVVAIDSDGRIELLNRSAERLFGYRYDELYGQPVELLVPDDLRKQHVALRGAFLAQPRGRPMGAGRDLFGRRKDGSTVPIEVGLSPIRRDNVAGALATIIDISERKAAEQRQQILVNEIRHRSRNLLGLVQAIAVRTIGIDARKDFLDAIQVLARTQDLFLETANPMLSRIIENELAPFRRATQQGCDVALTPRAAQDLALIIHELTTNAVKHGALSVPEGGVTISGRTDGPWFIFQWEEHDGPSVKPPVRKGFGQAILQNVAKSFCNQVTATYAESGFRYELRADLGNITTNVVDLAERRAT